MSMKWCCDWRICRIKAKDVSYSVDDNSKHKKGKDKNRNTVPTISHNE